MAYTGTSAATGSAAQGYTAQMGEQNLLLMFHEALLPEFMLS